MYKGIKIRISFMEPSMNINMSEKDVHGGLFMPFDRSQL